MVHALLSQDASRVHSLQRLQLVLTSSNHLQTTRLERRQASLEAQSSLWADCPGIHPAAWAGFAACTELCAGAAAHPAVPDLAGLKLAGACLHGLLLLLRLQCRCTLGFTSSSAVTAETSLQGVGRVVSR